MLQMMSHSEFKTLEGASITIGNESYSVAEDPKTLDYLILKTKDGKRYRVLKAAIWPFE